MIDENDRVIPQDAPYNILWRIFRAQVEQTKVPRVIAVRNLRFLKEKGKISHE